MQQVTDQKQTQFVDRRQSNSGQAPGVERRQFSTNHTSADPEVAELANAIDQYKLTHRRRFITFEELHQVIKSLGYTK